MPRVKRKNKSRNIRALTFYQVMALVVGWRDPLEYPFIPDYQLGYRTLKELKEAWELHRDNPRICQWLNPDDFEYRPGRRPYAWWRFESKEPRDYRISQEVQLEQLGELTEREKLELARSRKRKEQKEFIVPEPEGGFLPLPDPEPFSPDVQALREKATELVKNEDWFSWVAQPDGLLSPADADAVLNHGCRLDLERAFFACDFIETFCKQSEGEWEGQFIELMNWQKFDFLVPLFGWVTPDNIRRFSSASVWISKKQGKSTTCAGLECYGAVGDGEGGPKIFSAAVTKEQADIVHSWAAKMVQASPELRAILVPKDSKREIHIKDYRTSVESFVIKALAADANSNEGKHIFFLILDELHAWVDAAFFGALIHGNAARRQPLTISVSTAGEELDSLGGKRYLYTKNLIAGKLFNYSFFGLIYEAPVGLDYNNPQIYLNPKLWKLANPSLGITTSYRGFYDALLQALNNPKDWADFLRYRFNQWCGAGVPYLPMGDWYACGEETFEESFLHGRECYTGLDMSISDDTSALVHIFPVDELLYFIWRCWIPEDTISARFKEGDTKWKTWADSGLLIPASGAKIDHEIIFEQFRVDSQMFNIKEVAFDKYKADWLSAKIQDTGVQVVEFFQSPAAYDFATKEFKSLIQAKRLRLGRNAAVDYQAGNLSVKTTYKNEVMPVKRAGERTFKIDLMVAAIMALDRVLRHVDEVSEYESKETMFSGK